MKEIALFTSARSIDETVLSLGKLGAVDIREVDPAEGDRIAPRREAVQRAEKAVAILESRPKPGKGSADGKKFRFKDPQRLTDRLLIAQTFKRQTLERLEELRHQRAWYEAWGSGVDPRDLDLLREHGLHLRLYRIERSGLAALPAREDLVTFPEHDGKLPVALVATDPTEKLPFPEDAPPELSLRAVEREIAKKERQARMVEQYWNDQAEHLHDLQDYLALLRDRLRLEEVMEGMGDVEGKVRYLRGYIPNQAVEAFKAEAEREHWGYQIRDPEHPEDVPVEIRNPRWIRIIDPVMKFIGIVPGYEELDVSIFFLIAFALFFAMLVGDAGYGAIFLVLTLLLRKKIPADIRVLFFVLSGATIIWGVLSGTYFGSEKIASLPFFQRLIIDDIASFGVDNIDFMMHLSFLIGAIHLTVAHGIQAVRVINSTRALSELGWIALVWGLYLLVEKLVLGKDLPGWAPWLFVGGALLVTLFTREGKNLVQSMLISVANLPLALINGFSDIVSYVRLFAVGLATAAVAASFNNMILPEGGGMSFLQMIGAGIALTLGHGLNIALALMAVLVHGIRLNMLEFASHLGVEFSGKAYRPFQLKALLREQENGGE